MQEVVRLLEVNTVYIMVGLMAMSLISLILLIILLIKNSKLKKKYNEFMRGSQTDIEGLLREFMGKSTDIEESYKYLTDSVAGIEAQIKNCVQKVGFLRYGAVPGVGADLSFVVAFLDEEDNGVVINGIYTRDGSYTYAKDVIAGQSKYTLSDEEKEAIMRAKQI